MNLRFIDRYFYILSSLRINSSVDYLKNFFRIIIFGMADSLIFYSSYPLKFYNRAIMSISLNQAGLSVLNSFAHGVPFVTMNNAASGGEKFNIVNNYNGIFLNKKWYIVK